MRLGLLERHTPLSAWSDSDAPWAKDVAAIGDPEEYLGQRRGAAPRFLFDPGDAPSYKPYFQAWDAIGVGPADRVDALMQGRMLYFEQAEAQSGFPPEWHRNPFTGAQAPAECHWSRIGDVDHGDIKVIWEPSRFGFTYALVRAYWRTADGRYPEAFWTLVEDWRAHNPPNRGPNWMCGQETSFRVMAWCFGLYGFLNAPATTAERVTVLGEMVAASGHRIAANLGYALSQNNNHGVSEGVGLWTIGLLFPEFPQAERWKSKGREVMECLGRELIYEDGAFGQHSVNYQRLVIHDYLWALRLGDLNGEPLSRVLRDRIAAASALLYQLQDDESGWLPCYGQNDGALILPLSNCHHRDFRPAIQAGRYLETGRRCYGPGPWDEELLWLCGPDALEAEPDAPARVDLRAEIGGYYTLRSKTGFAFTRCAEFRHRPGQADMLHVDVWWRGRNIALDPGTYSYNAPAPWSNPLAETSYHNTVLVDDLDQMERVGKFLWLPWIPGRVRRSSAIEASDVAYWEGEHDGYRRLRAPVCYRRAVLHLGPEHWLVFDQLSCREQHTYRLHWLLADLPFAFDAEGRRVVLDTPHGPYRVQLVADDGNGDCTVVRGDEHSPRGWYAPAYGLRVPAVSLDLTLRGSTVNLATILGPEPIRHQTEGEALIIATENRTCRVTFGPAEDWRAPLVASVVENGPVRRHGR